MSAKHTPGPWEAVSGTNNGWEVRAKIGSHNFAEFTTKADAMSAVFIEPWSRFQPDSYKEMTAANFRLAAAAPELLEALQMLYRETADYIRLNNLGDAHQNQSMQLARAALTKATGAA